MNFNASRIRLVNERFDMAVIVDCACGQKLRLPKHLAGKQVKCPRCGTGMVITPEQFEQFREMEIQKERDARQQERQVALAKIEAQRKEERKRLEERWAQLCDVWKHRPQPCSGCGSLVTFTADYNWQDMIECGHCGHFQQFTPQPLDESQALDMNNGITKWSMADPEEIEEAVLREKVAWLESKLRE